jgi:hypothetical protein
LQTIILIRDWHATKRPAPPAARRGP